MSKRVLVIEDHEENRRILRLLLTSAGIEMTEAVTGEEGVAAAEKEPPDLILMDIQLPGIDGITALKQLRAEPKTRNIPIIAITASAMTHNRQTMMAEGFDGYQTKPISLKDFLGEVERVLAVRRI
jgi:two-component system cell cycle response regulator DivK